MADTMKFNLVSPERLLASVEAKLAQIPGTDGEFTAMPDHAPFLTTLRPGLVRVHAEGGVTEYFVTGGFAEVSQTETSVLAEEAIERDLLRRDWLDEKLGAAEAALAAAPDHERIAAGQRVNDYRAVIGQLGL
jgi:F-type H+-transporting ATPase subunit epsilon